MYVCMFTFETEKEQGYGQGSYMYGDWSTTNITRMEGGKQWEESHVILHMLCTHIHCTVHDEGKLVTFQKLCMCRGS